MKCIENKGSFDNVSVSCFLYLVPCFSFFVSLFFNTKMKLCSITIRISVVIRYFHLKRNNMSCSTPYAFFFSCFEFGLQQYLLTLRNGKMVWVFRWKYLEKSAFKQSFHLTLTRKSKLKGEIRFLFAWGKSPWSN